MKLSKIKYPFLVLAGILVSVLLVSPAVKADSGYRRGLQHLYPYYIAGSEGQTIGLDESYTSPLRGDTDAQKVKNFANEQINLNEMGGIIFGSALHDISQFNPKFNQDNLCGIAGWECNSERWRRLLNFSELHSLNHQDLKTQLIFINLELNGLSSAVGSQGVYQDIFEDLKTTNTFVSSSSLFMQNYLGKDPLNLTESAQTLYNYEVAVEYNEDDPPPEPTPVEPPEPPDPPPEPTPTGQTINNSDCWAGLSGGYIATTNAGDQNGKFLESLSVVGIYSANQSTTTLMHRCLKGSIASMLNTYNSRVSAANKIGGWGWRSQAKQIELRKKHCGLSNYDIWEKAADECDPDTARPGYSSHQDGLAIDFYCFGDTLSRNNCNGFFNWLDCNAAQYGLINLPSEPWHWYYPLKNPSKLADKKRQGC